MKHRLLIVHRFVMSHRLPIVHRFVMNYMLLVISGPVNHHWFLDNHRLVYYHRPMNYWLAAYNWT